MKKASAFSQSKIYSDLLKYGNIKIKCVIFADAIYLWHLDFRSKREYNTEDNQPLFYGIYIHFCHFAKSISP